MPTLEVQGEQTVPAVDNLFRSLERKGCPNLKIRHNIENWQLGGKCALIQFIITWAQKCPSSKLITHIHPRREEDKKVKDATERDHLLIAFILAHKILAENKNKNLAERTKKWASRRLEEMKDTLGATIDVVKKGNKALLLCTDETRDVKTSNVHIPHFYHKNGNVRDEQEFTALITDIFYRINSEGKLPKAKSFISDDLNPEDFEELGSILYELFHNTHTWATTDHLGDKINNSVRGIFVDAHSATADRLREMSIKSPPQREFIENEYDDNDDRLTFLEVSVFDSGPGLAARYLSTEWDEDVSLRDEFAACLRCLRKWETSTGESHRGVGLVNVMRSLTALHGFWRIRTGRVNVCRNFAKRPYSDKPTDPQPSLFDNPHLVDWYTGSARDLTTLPRAEGTLSTMLIPLNRER